MTDRRPLVDVLVPAFNAERTIEEAIASVQRQTIADLRIIVVNDGSTDRTSDLVHALGARDPRIAIVDQVNGGIVAARNRTIELSTAPYLAMHDADDRSFPDRLARQLAYLQANPDCVAVSGNAWYMDGDGRRLGGRSGFGGDVRPDPYAFPSAEPYLPQPFVMIRRDAVVAVGGYRELTNAEDTDLYWRLLSVGRLHNLADVLGEYRMHGVSASAAAAKSGRLSAVNSQLSALSHRRREEGRPDLEFSPDRARRLAAVDTVEQMIALVAQQLSAPETAYLRVAVAAKLLELASYRPYLLALTDCCFLHDALPAALAGGTRHDRRRQAYRQAHVVGRLLRKRRWAEIRALGAPLTAYASILPALAMRKAKALLQR